VIRAPRERGSAVVDFALVVPLVLLVCVAVVQLSVWASQRATAHSLAFDAARAGAVAPGSAGQRVVVARDAATATVPRADVSARIDDLEGVRVVAVELPVRMALLGWDLPVRSTVVGHVPLEPR
jgi:hypothetical protein